MREILFRGKREDNGEWVEGLLTIDTFMNPDTGFRKAYCIKALPNENHECLYWLPVIPETVGQYTGLCDKNGKKIFEGDILRGVARWLNEAKNGRVTFEAGAFGFIWYRGDIEMFFPFTITCNITYEVIGNIYDNPELLKGGAE